MKTRQSAADEASGNGHNKPKRKYIRRPKNKQQAAADDGAGEQKLLNTTPINLVSIAESAVALEEEAKTSEEPSANGRSPNAELGSAVVESKPELEDCYQLAEGRDTAASDPLILLAGCNNGVKYEVMDFGSQQNKSPEENNPTVLSLLAANGSTTMLKPNDEVRKRSISPSSKEADNPAPTCSIAMKTEKLLNSQSNKTISTYSFNGAFKLYRFMICEWFYSHVDRVLFAEGYGKNLDMSVLLKKHFPLLFTRSLNRAQWNFVRKKLRAIRPVRRLSHAFLLQERINLERERENLRYLMENPMIEYLDDDIPITVPKPIEVGSTVRCTSFVPQYGSYSGEVIGVEKLEVPYFRIRFTNEGNASEQLLPDYRVALEQSFHLPDASDTVTVTFKHLKQIALLEEHLNEKKRLLHALENIRLNLAARHVLGTRNADDDRDQIDRYDLTVRKLIQVNRTLMQLLKQISADYERYVSEPLTLEDDEESHPVVDRYVVEVADELLTGYSQLDDVLNNPVADQLWQTTMQRLRRRPEYLQQFEAYLASRVRSSRILRPGLESS